MRPPYLVYMDPKDFAPYSKTVDKAYDDAVSPGAKKTGELAADGIDAAHRLLHPLFDLVRHGGDRLQKLVNQAALNVPIERQQPAPTNIAGPVLWNLYFTEDGSELQAMYLRLLQHSIDKDNVDKAHPAFIRTIEALSPLEAMFLKTIREKAIHNQFCVNKVDSSQHFNWTIKTFFPEFYPLGFNIYHPAYHHLESMGLVYFSNIPKNWLPEKGRHVNVTISLFLSTWGQSFCDVCLPTDSDTPSE